MKDSELDKLFKQSYVVVDAKELVALKQRLERYEVALRALDCGEPSCMECRIIHTALKESV